MKENKTMNFLQLIKEFYNFDNDIDNPNEIYLLLKGLSNSYSQEEKEQYYQFDCLIAELLKIYEFEQHPWSESQNCTELPVWKE